MCAKALESEACLAHPWVTQEADMLTWKELERRMVEDMSRKAMMGVVRDSTAFFRPL